MAGSSAPAATSVPVSSAEAPCPRLTMLQLPAKGSESKLTDDEKAALLEDARWCLEKMRKLRNVAGELILHECVSDAVPAYVAAALALRCGRFQFKSGKPNVSAAARACDKPTNHPELINQWHSKLEELETALQREEHREREREQEAGRALGKVVHQCIQRAIANVLLEARSADARLEEQRAQAWEAGRALERQVAAEAQGLFAREVCIMAPSAERVRHFAGSWLDALAAWRLEYEGDCARSIWAERCTPIWQNGSGFSTWWYEEDEATYVEHVGSGSTEHAAYLAHLQRVRPEHHGVVDRARKHALRGYIFGVHVEHPALDSFLARVHELEVEHGVVCMLSTVSAGQQWWHDRIEIFHQHHRGNRIGQVAYHIAWSARSCLANVIYQLEQLPVEETSNDVRLMLCSPSPADAARAAREVANAARHKVTQTGTKMEKAKGNEAVREASRAHYDAVSAWKAALARAEELETQAPPEVLMTSGAYRLLADGRILHREGTTDREMGTPPYYTLWSRIRLQADGYEGRRAKVDVECWSSSRDGLSRATRFADFSIFCRERAEAYRWLAALDRFTPALPHPQDLQPVLERVFGAPVVSYTSQTGLMSAELRHRPSPPGLAFRDRSDAAYQHVEYVGKKKKRGFWSII